MKMRAGELCVAVRRNALQESRKRAAMDDEHLYEQVSEEMAAGDIKPGMWTKAYANAMGDENKAKAIYIRMRVEALSREEARKEHEALGVEEVDKDGALFPERRLEERIPPGVMNALQIGGFVVGLIAIWFFRGDLANVGRRLKHLLSGGG
jgi:hypothetical protein